MHNATSFGLYLLIWPFLFRGGTPTPPFSLGRQPFVLSCAQASLRWHWGPHAPWANSLNEQQSQNSGQTAPTFTSRRSRPSATRSRSQHSSQIRSQGFPSQLTARSLEPPRRMVRKPGERSRKRARWPPFFMRAIAALVRACACLQKLKKIIGGNMFFFGHSRRLQTTHKAPVSIGREKLVSGCKVAWFLKNNKHGMGQKANRIIRKACPCPAIKKYP